MNQRINSLEEELTKDFLRLVDRYLRLRTNISMWAAFNQISKLSLKFENLLYPTENELILFELEFGEILTQQYLRIINESEK